MIVATLASLLLAAQHRGYEPKPVDRIQFQGQTALPILPGPRKAPLIELKIGGKPYHFLLDTGATGGRIAPEIVESLGLKPEGEVRAGDPSGKNSRQVKIYRIPEIVAGTTHLYGVRMFSVPTHTNNHLADGVIGYAVFQELLLSIDYAGKKVTLSKGVLPPSAIHYETEHGIPVLPIEIGNVKLIGHVDTGADGGLSVPMKYKDELPLAEPPKVIGHARTLFNSIDIYGAKVKGPVKIGGMTISVPMLELNEVLPFGNIGGRVLQQYVVTIDQRNRRIAFDRPSK